MDTETILTAIEDRNLRRQDIAILYADCIGYDPKSVDWQLVNQAIIKRWSRSGLNWIKAQAWKLYAANKPEGTPCQQS